jgi:uncharacterized protein YkwD
MLKPGGFWLVIAASLALAPAATPSPIQDVRAMRALVTATRTTHGKPALRFVPILDRAALLKAEAIRACGSFSHTPCGTPFARTFQRVGYLRSGGAVGENIAWGVGTSAAAEAVVRMWLASAPHRANLFNGRWREAGVALVNAPSFAGHNNARIWVLVLGRRG